MFHLNLPFASGGSCQGAEVSRALDVVSVGTLRDPPGAGGFHEEMRDFSKKKWWF